MSFTICAIIIEFHLYLSGIFRYLCIWNNAKKCHCGKKSDLPYSIYLCICCNRIFQRNGIYDASPFTGHRRHTVIVTQFHPDTPASNSSLLIYRQLSEIDLLRLPSTTKRTNHTNKKNFGFTRLSKGTLIGIKKIIPQKTLITRSSITRPGYRLIWLGKLII